MRLNHDSITAKIYRWFYGLYSSDNLTDDGCEYFKKLALALVLFIPLALVTLPITLMAFIKPETIKPTTRIGYMVFLSLVLFCLFAMGCTVAWFFVTFDNKSLISRMAPGGALLWIVVIGVALWHGIEAFIEHIKESRIERDENGRRIYGRPKQDNLLVAFYKAKKEKYCPKLEWYRKK